MPITYHTVEGCHYAQDSAGNSVSMPNQSEAARRRAAQQLGKDSNTRYARMQASYQRR